MLTARQPLRVGTDGLPTLLATTAIRSIPGETLVYRRSGSTSLIPTGTSLFASFTSSTGTALSATSQPSNSGQSSIIYGSGSTENSGTHDSSIKTLGNSQSAILGSSGITTRETGTSGQTFETHSTENGDDSRTQSYPSQTSTTPLHDISITAKSIDSNTKSMSSSVVPAATFLVSLTDRVAQSTITGRTSTGSTLSSYSGRTSLFTSAMPTSNTKPGVVPATLTTALDPTGAEASSSASSLQVFIIFAQRKVQKFVTDDQNIQLKDEAKDEIDRDIVFIKNMLKKFDKPEDDGGDCTSGGLLGIFHIASCTLKDLEDLDEDFGKTKVDIEQIKTDLSDLVVNVQPLVPDEPVPDPPEEEPDDEPKTESQPSETEKEDQSKTDPAKTDPAKTDPATSRAATSSAARAQYIVFASSSADANSIKSMLSAKAPIPSKILFIEATGVLSAWAIPSDGTDAAVAGLSSAEVDDIEAQPGILSVVTNAAVTDSPDPTGTDQDGSAGEPSFVTLTADGPQATGANAKRNVAPVDDSEEVWSKTRQRLRMSGRTDRHESMDLVKRMPRQYALNVQDREDPPRTDGMDVPYELRAVSQPNVNPLPELEELDYAWRSDFADDTWAYVVDTGIYGGHRVGA